MYALRVPVYFLEQRTSKMDTVLSEWQGYSLMELTGMSLLTRPQRQASYYMAEGEEGRERQTVTEQHRVTVNESKRPSITEGAGAALAWMQHSHPSLHLPLEVDLSIETTAAVICTNALLSTSHVKLWV